MSKVVFKSNFTRSGSKAVSNMKYIATREGVDKTINTKMLLNNLEYIAHRPRVVKLGEHGLFGQEDMVDFDKAKAELENHRGIVWMPIVSLHREDAQGWDMIICKDGERFFVQCKLNWQSVIAFQLTILSGMLPTTMKVITHTYI